MRGQADDGEMCGLVVEVEMEMQREKKPQWQQEL